MGAFTHYICLCAKKLYFIDLNGPWAIDSIKASQIVLTCSHAENYCNCLLTRCSHLFGMITISGKFSTHLNLVVNRICVILIIIKILHKYRMLGLEANLEIRLLHGVNE